MTLSSDVSTPTPKRSLVEGISKEGADPPAKKKARKGPTEAEKLAKSVKQVTRAIQGQINAKLKWKSSFKGMKGTGNTKGCRCEVVCTDPKVFEAIFADGDIKKSKDGSKLSVSFKEDSDVYDLPFRGKSYRFDDATLRAPVSANLKDCALTFNFKFSI